jgi:hypothetical protein
VSLQEFMLRGQQYTLSVYLDGAESLSSWKNVELIEAEHY